jgi:hypothetical protein
MILELIWMANAVAAQPAAFPVFLRQGFSAVLEFEEAPSRVVIGDAQKFQVERLEKSLVVKALAPYAATNMFVYFKAKEPRLFVLTASEDAQPTFYKSFEPEPAAPAPLLAHPRPHSIPSPARRGGRVLSAKFDEKKDYLTVEITLSAASTEPIHPAWASVRLRFGESAIAPERLWAERKDVQKDAQVRARFVFAKPNVPRNLRGVSLVVPITGDINPILLPLGGKR